MKTIKNFFGMQWKEGGIVADCQLMNDSWGNRTANNLLFSGSSGSFSESYCNLELSDFEWELYYLEINFCVAVSPNFGLTLSGQPHIYLLLTSCEGLSNKPWRKSNLIVSYKSRSESQSDFRFQMFRWLINAFDFSTTFVTCSQINFVSGFVY